LNYTENTFIKMSFIEGTAPDASSGLIDSPQNILEAGTFTLVGTTPSYKVLLERNGSEWVVTDPSDGEIFDVYSAFPSSEWGGLIRSRGPPEEGSVILADYRYEYDSASRRVYAYDVTNDRYALYDWKDPETPRLLEQGNIVTDPNGNIVSRTATKTYNAEILGAVTVPATEYEPSSAFASASAALQLRPDIAASQIQNVSILTDAADANRLTVVLSVGTTEYHYSYDIQANTSVLAKIRVPKGDGTYAITEYDAQGRVTKESVEAADGSVTVVKTYRYETAGEVIIIDSVNHTIRVASLNADGTAGQTLRAGFYNDEDQIYSLQGPGDTEAKWYTYGTEGTGDGIMMTADDAPTSRPVRGPQPGEAGKPWRRPGGQNTNLEELIRQLK